MATFAELISDGERIRETISVQGAIQFFETAASIAENDIQLTEAFRHRGLCYEHLGDQKTSAELYTLALESAERANDPASIARCKRHMLAICVKRADFATAIRLGIEARNLMLSLAEIPADMVWVTHGLCKAYIASNHPKKIVRMWVKFAYPELVYAFSKEPLSYRKRVWLTGWLADAAYGWAPIGYILLGVAFVISAYGKLVVRKSQFKAGKR